MGRKASKRIRKDDPAKKRKWIKELYPHLRDNGVKDLRMDTVAKYLGKSKSTVYEYFSSKEEIISGTIALKLDALLGFESILMNQEENLSDRYQNMMAHIIPIISDISQVLLADIKKYYPELWQIIDAFYNHAGEVLLKFYEEGIGDGTFLQINPIILVQQDKFFFNEVIDPHFLAENNITPEAAFKDFFELKLKGLWVK